MLKISIPLSKIQTQDPGKQLIDSKRSDECIDFAMMSVFFFI